jgi:hypothetical protein
MGDDLRLLECLGEDLTERAISLRAALRELDRSTEAPIHAAYQRSREELDKLEDLAHALCAVAHEARPGEGLVPADLLEPIRRAASQRGGRRPADLTVRVDAPFDVPRVLARPALLVRTLGLCLDASSLVSREGGAVVVRVAGARDGERVSAQFNAAPSLTVLSPGLRRRLLSTLALAKRLASTFDAELDVDAAGGTLAPRLLLLAERAA